MSRRALPLVITPLCVAALGVAASAGPAMAGDDRRSGAFEPLGAFQVQGQVAEILAVTPDGGTLLYTDSAEEEVGIVDLTLPQQPRQLGAVDVAGEPTSVAVTRDGRHALVVVDTTTGFTSPSGNLTVLDLRTRAKVAVIQLGGQPDSIAISPDGAAAAIAVENQRDEEREVGGIEGGLPQAPAGFLAVVGLDGQPSSWRSDRVRLTGLPGTTYPGDPEPEYVDINRNGIAAVTLQENNAVALVDLDRRAVIGSFSAGSTSRRDADLSDDGTIAFDDPFRAPREPDAVQWTPHGNLMTADEGDLAPEPSGGRGWTVFSRGGEVRYTSGGAAERALATEGYYPDDRSDDKGAEIEGAEIASFAECSYAFVGSERGNAVLVYDFRDERHPRLVQVLATGAAPEGLLAVPGRQLFLTSNEDDGTISIFRFRAPR